MITKFYVANLPRGCTPWDLRKSLEGFREIAGTYVAKKRDKGGGRFGFVSFLDVRDRCELEKSLHGARMGAYKLKVNIVRFAVENSGFDVRKDARANIGSSAGLEGKRNSFNTRDSRSYSEVLGKAKVIGEPSVDARGIRGVNEKVRTVDLETLVDFDRLLRIAGTEFSRIQYLGGLSILISFRNEESAKEFLNARVVWDPWFSKLETWNGQSLSLERMVWLKVLGVPLHILEPGLLDQIGGMFGKVLHVPKLLDEDHDLSVSRVGILVGEPHRIRENVVLKWKNCCYRVWVEEEENDWIPDCLVRSDSVSFGEGSPVQSSPVGQVLVDLEVGCEDSRKVGSHLVGEGSGLFFSKGDMGKEYSNYEETAAKVFPDFEVGSTSKLGGDNSRKIFFFKSKKRSRRCRIRVGRAHSVDPFSSHWEFLDSSEKGRPNKRNRAQNSDFCDDLFNYRAQEAVNSELFSLNRLLDQVSKDKVEGDVAQTAIPSVPVPPPFRLGSLRWIWK
ncbi:putative RNA recognition motif domain, nucleotide-binding alpha-beta plait domain superfamily [Helianthus annuus]|uniref:RNA recognition motif domain, nucleotide-binding alpha-beta plait domain superfamily n=1 Tax=Helianthus annuus TaxID=4232 RepID=A0A9K3P297_HELAN|nr:putative RNA recognition motif domain, nucleotide-binding alpha-beta plait domain superfamily [Helianthus annuus]KAJ0611625.1 putative RNA recognition motif domain, nucleotide-binding alpha-beta plait domain superfamily [Helianthus annuus]KAJ0626937.1 putative RNA recognition motif domain, nucleotide-binding alpha-beta plait domain superfamily [Helianthus annuus]KAJ0948026.1 putative RNA recognition motif domain, nucleotide-binding alpha-beta plait domain superfamily [Helianthus annuus]